MKPKFMCGITIGNARKVNSNDSGHLLFFIIVSPREGGGLLAGILPQVWPRSAGLLAGLWKLKS